VRVYAVVSEQMSDEALELFVDREMAELMVENWDRDEPDRAGEALRRAGRARDLAGLANERPRPDCRCGTWAWPTTGSPDSVGSAS
jgi:hypothetical protein